MPLHPPLDQFAHRIINNGELRTFIQGLLEMGVRQRDILAALKPDDRGPEDDRAIVTWYKRTLADLNDVSNHPTRERVRGGT